jgi:hypothetical protein
MQIRFLPSHAVFIESAISMIGGGERPRMHRWLFFVAMK